MPSGSGTAGPPRARGTTWSAVKSHTEPHRAQKGCSSLALADASRHAAVL